MQGDDFFEEYCFGTGDILNRLTRHRLRKEADEITRMPRLERDTDFAVSFESPNPGTVSCARVNNDEWSPRGIELHAHRRQNPRERVINWSIKLAAIDNELHLIVKHVRGGFG